MKNIPIEVEDNKWKKENDNGSEAQLTFYFRWKLELNSLKVLQAFTLFTRKAVCPYAQYPSNYLIRVYCA